MASIAILINITLFIIIFITQNKNSMTLQELTQGLTDLTAQVQKIGTESQNTLQKVSDLETALQNAQNEGTDIPQGVTDAFNALKTSVQTVDDLVPDVPAAS